MNLHSRRSTSGRNSSAYSLRTTELIPSQATTDVVVVPVLLGGRERHVEPQLDAQVAGTIDQDLEQPHPSDAGEAVTGRHRPDTLVHDGNVVPVCEVRPDRGSADRIVLVHVGERVIGQHDSPSERVAGGVAFEHRHLVRRIAQLHRDREVQTGRSAAQAEHPHRIAPIRIAPDPIVTV